MIDENNTLWYDRVINRSIKKNASSKLEAPLQEGEETKIETTGNEQGVKHYANLRRGTRGRLKDDLFLYTGLIDKETHARSTRNQVTTCQTACN